jgi:hypothetical protein
MMCPKAARLLFCVCALSWALTGCGDDVAPHPDAAVTAPGVTVHGQVLSAPGQPVPIVGVKVSVIDPIADPDALLSAETDIHGVFAIHDVHPNAAGRVRLLIDGTTGGGGPFILVNQDFPVDPQTGADVGVFRTQRAAYDPERDDADVPAGRAASRQHHAHRPVGAPRGPAQGRRWTALHQLLCDAPAAWAEARRAGESPAPASR